MQFQEVVQAQVHLIDSETRPMDACGARAGHPPAGRRLLNVPPAIQEAAGRAALPADPKPKERARLSFAFMSNGISSERQLETAVRQTAALLQQVIEQKQDVVVVAGPVVVHTGGAPPLADLIRRGYVQALLSGNALGVHDPEAALLGTSLGVRMADGRQEEHGHRNHMRAINTIYHCGSIRQAVETGCLRSRVLYECVKNRLPFILPGSLGDDGPLPDTMTDINQSQDAYPHGDKEAC